MQRLVLWVLFASLPAAAQTTSGSIVGKVTDPSGAVVAAAAVTATNVDTGIDNKTTSDPSGNFVITPLPIGNYSVTVEMAGFKKWSSSGITLNVQDRIGLNVVLEVGQLTETVEVVGAAPALQTDTSYLGQVVESQRIIDLPLNGRFFTRLAVLTSGTLPTAPGARDERTGGFSSNGVRPYQNNYMLDGGTEAWPEFGRSSIYTTVGEDLYAELASYRVRKPVRNYGTTKRCCGTRFEAP